MLPYGRTVGLAAAGPLLLALGLASSTVVAADVGVAAGVVPALVVAVVVVPAVVLIARRSPGGIAGGLALRRPAASVVGVAVVGGSAAVVLAGDALLGGTRIVALDPGVLLGWLAATVALAVLQEVVPEELALRGLTVSVLRGRAGPVVVVSGSAVVFAMAAVLGSALGSGATQLFGLTTSGVRFAPEGQRPLDYVVLLVLFGVVLGLLRVVTDSVWAPMSGHVTFLVLNRLFVVPRDDTGLAVETAPGAELLAVVHLLLAAVTLAFVAGTARRRRVTGDNPPPRDTDGQTTRPSPG